MTLTTATPNNTPLTNINNRTTANMKHEDGIELFLTDSEGNAYIDRPRNSWSSVPAQHTTRYSYMDVCVPPGTRFGICLQLSPAFKLYKEDALSLSMVESQPGAFHSFLLTRWSIDRLQSEDVGLQRLWIEQSKQGKYLEMPSATRTWHIRLGTELMPTGSRLLQSKR